MPSILALTNSTSLLAETRGIIISGTTGVPFFVASTVASKIALACISYISGTVTPTRTPRIPSMGLYSAKVSILLTTRESGKSRASAKSCIPSRSFGKNSCRGGSKSLIQTGSPFIKVKSSRKSDLCIGSNLSNTALRSSLSSAKIISRIKVRRSDSKNMCSVRQSPIPCALKF